MAPLQAVGDVGEDEPGWEAVEKLNRDLREIARRATSQEARFNVETYYQLQQNRIEQANRQRTMRKDGEPTEIIEHFANQFGTLEKQMVSILGIWAAEQPGGEWLQNVHGIGPVLSAGFLAFIDITRVRTAGQIWSYAGYNPNMVWEKGQKRPYNATLKTLCWKAGDCFVRSSGSEKSFYGKVYRERKEYELRRDGRDIDSGEILGDAEPINQATAATSLMTKNIKDADLKALYLSGHLPLGRLDLRSRRYAVKLMLAHLFEVLYEAHYGRPAPLPYPIANPDMPQHVHQIARPA